MFPKYFQQELTSLRELGAEFSKEHPALAPMLSGAHTDPDVERLLEGTAFLTALLRQKLDDEFPEVIHDLLQVVAPQYLNPTPSTSIVVFSPKATVRNSIKLPVGIQCASTPIEGTTCFFRTCYEVELHPLILADAAFVQVPGRSPEIKISFELNGASLSQWKPSAVRLYLADDFPQASDLYMVLRRHVRTIRLVPQKKGESFNLQPSELHPVGFTAEEGLRPAAGNSFHGFGVLQDYFSMPQKFLFLDLVGWEKWQSRGEGKTFDVIFELNESPAPPLRVNKNSFLLHATPVINLFEHDAEPIHLDHRKMEYPLYPADMSKETQIYSVDEVKGFTQGTAQEKSYKAFDLFHRGETDSPVFHLTRTPSLRTDGVQLSLSVAYGDDEEIPAEEETLVARLKCTNGVLAGRLKAGDINTHSKGCPEYVTFKNILPPTFGAPSKIGKNVLWQLVSHLAMGFQSLEKAETLKSLLGLYIFSETSDPETLANRKRVEGILEISSAARDYLISGVVARGRELTIKVREDHFASRGDLYLFGNILDSFFMNFASINSFVSLKMKDVTGGREITWPARIGNRHLV